MTLSSVFPSACKMLLIADSLSAAFTTTSHLSLCSLNLHFLEGSLVFFLHSANSSPHTLHMCPLHFHCFSIQLPQVEYIEHSITLCYFSGTELWLVFSKTRVLLAYAWIAHLTRGEMRSRFHSPQPYTLLVGFC